LHDDVLIPDLAGWRLERAPEDLDAPRVDIPPDWLCEVLSPSTRRFDRARKMVIYARHAIEYAWLLDPIDRTLEVKRLHSGQWTDLGVFSEGIVRAEPFEAIEIDLEKIWGASPLPAP
jgi:Uma2 family endonuclease